MSNYSLRLAPCIPSRKASIGTVGGLCRGSKRARAIGARYGIIGASLRISRSRVALPMALPLFELPPSTQRDWLVERLARPAPPEARNLSDGFRLPGRHGAPTAAAVLVPLINRD